MAEPAYLCVFKRNTNFIFGVANRVGKNGIGGRWLASHGNHGSPKSNIDRQDALSVILKEN